jgi:hypothetical protein
VQKIKKLWTMKTVKESKMGMVSFLWFGKILSTIFN